MRDFERERGTVCSRLRDSQRERDGEKLSAKSAHYREALCA